MFLQVGLFSLVPPLSPPTLLKRPARAPSLAARAARTTMTSATVSWKGMWYGETRLLQPLNILYVKIPVVPHKAVAEVSKVGNYRKEQLLWCMDGRANPLMARKVVEALNLSLSLYSSLCHLLSVSLYLSLCLSICLSIDLWCSVV